MDRKAAEELHSKLLLELKKQKPSFENVLWVPLLGVSAYFVYETFAGGVLGCLIGWGFTAIFTRLDDVKRYNAYLAFLHHLHEYTDEAEAGTIKADIEMALDRASKRWF